MFINNFNKEELWLDFIKEYTASKYNARMNKILYINVYQRES